MHPATLSKADCVTKSLMVPKTLRFFDQRLEDRDLCGIVVRSLLGLVDAGRRTGLEVGSVLADLRKLVQDEGAEFFFRAPGLKLHHWHWRRAWERSACGGRHGFHRQGHRD